MSENCHILYCVPSFSEKGGTERSIANKMNLLADLGYKVTLLISEKKNDDFAFPLSEKITVIPLQISQHITSGIPGFDFFRNVRSLKPIYEKIISENAPDIVIVSERGYEDFIIPNILPKIPKVRELHSSLQAVNLMFKQRLSDKILTWFYNRQITKYNHLIYLTEADAQYRNINAPYSVIPNFVTFEKPFQKRDVSKKIISVGRLDSFKNFKDQIIVMQTIITKHPEYTLHIFGEGKEKEHLNKLIKEKNLEQNVFLHGATSEISNKYDDADFFIFTSLAEGFGMVLVEAMRHQLPVISYNCSCGPNEIIEDEKDGFLVPIKNIRMLEEKMFFLIENNDIRTEMAVKAFENSKRFLPEFILPKWTQLFNILSKK